jgi:hypothetical protein
MFVCSLSHAVRSSISKGSCRTVTVTVAVTRGIERFVQEGAYDGLRIRVIYESKSASQAPDIHVLRAFTDTSVFLRVIF